MSVGAICFTSSGSNGGCWVVLVFPRLFLGKMGFFPHTRLTPKKKFTRLTPKKKNFRRKKKRDLRQKKKLRNLCQKKIKKRLTLISTIELRFPPFSGGPKEWRFAQSAFQNRSRCTCPLGGSLRAASWSMDSAAPPPDIRPSDCPRQQRDRTGGGGCGSVGDGGDEAGRGRAAKSQGVAAEGGRPTQSLRFGPLNRCPLTARPV